MTEPLYIKFNQEELIKGEPSDSRLFTKEQVIALINYDRKRLIELLGKTDVEIPLIFNSKISFTTGAESV
jgi:hypothetical protein